ncbi:MAG: hypothetical protein EB828_00090 [Nitrosopumilus sp. D6]|nr:MAG: hypothetical protein EB828_00090 [Nitrosopumilus sp. D6]
MNDSCSTSLLFVMQDLTIAGRTRIQKYGFHIYQQYKDELEGHDFYSDWRPYHFGPYSQMLADDLQKAISNGYVKISDDPSGDSKYKQYGVTLKGRNVYRSLLADNAFLNDIHEMLVNLQHQSLMKILKQIYMDYPQYTVRSQIKDDATRG